MPNCRLYSVLFQNKDPRAAERYARLADVLALSAAENSPSTPLTVEWIEGQWEPESYRGCKPVWIENAHKAHCHWQAMRQADDGEVIGFLDIDTMVLGDCSEIESLPFDIAYTVRPNRTPWILNTGVYFVRVSDKTRLFMLTWLNTVLRMLRDKHFHDEWRAARKYGGIHQAALGWMLEHAGPAKWNCVSCCWRDAGEHTRIAHIMSSLRRTCFEPTKVLPRNDGEKYLMKRWRAYDEKARACA